MTSIACSSGTKVDDQDAVYSYGNLTPVPPLYFLRGGDSSSENKWSDDLGGDSDEEFQFNINPSLLLDLSKLQIEEVIGEGASSVVYEGMYESQPVAVKVILPFRTALARRATKENFQREVNSLAKVKHENIVKFVGAIVEPKMMIVSELIKGGTLHGYLKAIFHEKPDLEKSIKFALDISRAMTCLHANNIIHRDLKPGNLLLTEDWTTLKLGDFGLARDESADVMTTEAGTYRWMAPELFFIEPVPKGEKKRYDHKVDVFSFAIVLWMLLTNKFPFRGSSNIMAAYATARNIRPSLDNIPEALKTLLESCWAAEPNDRPEFREITEFLTRFQRLELSYENASQAMDATEAITRMQEMSETPGPAEGVDPNSQGKNLMSERTDFLTRLQRLEFRNHNAYPTMEAGEAMTGVQEMPEAPEVDNLETPGPHILDPKPKRKTKKRKRVSIMSLKCFFCFQ